jgi:hypothetical protein
MSMGLDWAVLGVWGGAWGVCMGCVGCEWAQMDVDVVAFLRSQGECAVCKNSGSCPPGTKVPRQNRAPAQEYHQDEKAQASVMMQPISLIVAIEDSPTRVRYGQPGIARYWALVLGIGLYIALYWAVLGIDLVSASFGTVLFVCPHTVHVV